MFPKVLRTRFSSTAKESVPKSVKESEKTVREVVKFKTPLPLEHAKRFIALMPAAMCLIDAQGCMLHSNEAFRAMIDFSSCKDTNILQLIAPDNLDLFYRNIQQCLKPLMTGTQVRRCLSNTKCGNSRRDIRECTWEIRKEEGPCEYLIVIVSFSDAAALRHSTSSSDSSGFAGVFERKKETNPAKPGVVSIQASASMEWERFDSKVTSKTEQSLRFKEEQKKCQALSSSLESKRTFVKHISHEIRTPLNVVSNGLELLTRSFTSMPDDMISIVSEIQHSCLAAIDVLNDILTFEKLDGNHLIVEKSPERVTALVNTALNMFKIQAKNARLSMSVSFECDENLFVDVDAPKIIQVLRNLISNALKFTPSGGDVRVVCKVDGDQVRVEVHDNGVGMRTVDRERLFNEVVQFDAKALQNGGGSGLGLFLSAKVIEMHGGIIGVDMQRAAPGSTFFIALPIHSVGAADGGESSSPPPQQFTVSSLRTTTARVLLVDDVPMCRKFHVHMLKDSVKELVEACDGEEAVERVKQSMAAGEPFDAVIMDSCMPKLSGPLAARIMRDMGFKGKIFAVTGNAFESDIEDCIAHGADHVLVKPIRAENYAFIMDCL